MSKNVPKLRFPGFTDDWKEKKLWEISDALTYGLNSAACNYDGINGYIRITDIDTEGNYISSNKVSPEGDFSEEYMVKEGDILFARTGASTGKIYMYKKSDGKLFYAGFLIRARINKEHVCGYVYYSMRTNRYNNWVKLMSTRSGQPGINAKEYSSYELFLPSAFEQKKLANFLSTLDSRITLQSQKVEKLEELKKGYMQKIFSQELRFKREDGSEYGEWEDKKLGEIVSIKTGKLDANAMSEDGKYAFFTCSKENYKTDTFAFDGEALLIAGNGDIGVVKYYNGKFNAYQRTYVVQNSKENIKFLKFMVEYFLPKQIYDNTLGSAMPYITLSVLTDMIITNPFPEEQTKIADFLSSFDKQIEMEKKELEKLQELKKGLLQQMFV